MNSLDILVLVLVFVFGVVGAIRGFAWQLLRLLSLVLAFWLAWHYGAEVGGWLGGVGLDLDESARTLLAWVGIFASVYVVSFFLLRLTRPLIKKAQLGSADRTLGFLIGALKALALSAIGIQLLIMGTAVFPDAVVPKVVQQQMWGDKDAGIRHSNAVRLHQRLLGERVAGKLPPDLQEKLLRSLQQMREERKREDGR